MNGDNDNRFISKSNTGFPDYLDWKSLRSKGIQDIGELSGKIWTDHNVHDPGITILEVLCYALIDLGYRTNQPVKDLIAFPEGNENDMGGFFTPGQILANNPLTITDYRKLLIDIPGVRNAWLEVATDQTADYFCRRQDPNIPDIIFREDGVPIQPARKDCCINFLNGIYKVFIDLEKNVEKVFANDPAGKKDFLDHMSTEIKNTLHAHRNLCEDFEDPVFFNRIDIGICANIELDANTNADEIYDQIAERMQNFLAPSPRFYTLQQLLNDKKRNIEDIYAGRPLEIRRSHGFLDTEELESMKIRPVIYVSDLYNELLQIRGVRTVRSLSVRTCNPDFQNLNNLDRWKFPIPKNHIPEFSTRCSNIHFFKNGVPLTIDTDKHEYALTLKLFGGKKIPYEVPSPFLDLPVENGMYNEEISEYYSIQNDFPKVYGITKGALPSDVADLRKAQALQLKGYLFFFDQLLANYVAQLSHLRKLFEFKDQTEGERRTYFTAIPDSVPELGKLLRFSGTEPKILAYPVSRKLLDTLIQTGLLECMDLEKDLPPIEFPNGVDVRLIVEDMQSAFTLDEISPVILKKSENCFFFYICTSSGEIALVSRSFFETEKEAMNAINILRFVALNEESYIRFTRKSGTQHSFDIESNLSDYGVYLQRLVENKDLYLKRRLQFLDHLLARFAESFTDFAILSYKNSNESDYALLTSSQNFLANIDQLTGNRGKAYDYLKNGWNNKNFSGLEKRFRAFTGIDFTRNKNLCHFEVFKHKIQYLYTLSFAGEPMVHSFEKFDSPEEAEQAAAAAFRKLGEISNYEVVPLPEQAGRYRFRIQTDTALPAYGLNEFPSQAEGYESVRLYTEAFSEKPLPDLIYISRNRYQVKLQDSSGQTLREMTEMPFSNDKALTLANRRINELNKWESVPETFVPGRLLALNIGTGNNRFIDADAFKQDTNDTILDKPGKFNYDLLDHQNRFKFTSLAEFDKAENAAADKDRMVLLMSDRQNFKVISEATDAHFIYIQSGETKEAVYAKEFRDHTQAINTLQAILEILDGFIYQLYITEIPDRWNFRFHLGLHPKERFRFEYVAADFSSEETAMKNFSAFRDQLGKLEPRVINKELFLVKSGAKASPLARLMDDSGKKVPTRKQVDEVSAQLKRTAEIHKPWPNVNPTMFRAGVRLDEMSECGQYGYRLVDNNRLLAAFIPPGKKASKEESERWMDKLAKDAFKNPSYLEICLGGDIVDERKDPCCNISWYHFQVKTLHPVWNEQESEKRILVLFESVRGYASEEEARKAFREQFYDIMMHAMDPDHYGKDQFISEEELMDESDSSACIQTGSTVFIPKETLEFLGGYPEGAIKNLVKICSRFPIRVIHPNASSGDRKKYEALFPCKPKKEIIDPVCDSSRNDKEYYFVLWFAEQVYWQSLQSYKDPIKCQEDFQFFLILLKYAGNYTVICDPCDGKFKVVVREVLAESVKRFGEEEAWGPKGLLHFICVSQSENSFHHFRQKEDCCHRFYVACEKTPFIHPCCYERPDQRDEVLDSLRKEVVRLSEMKLKASADKKNLWMNWPSIVGEGDSRILTDANHQKIARVSWNRDKENASHCRIEEVEIFYWILRGELVPEDGNFLIHTSPQDHILFEPIEGTDFKGEGWRKKLICTALYYPIVIREEILEGKIVSKYCIEWRIPTEIECSETGYHKLPCDCEPETDDRQCEIAWKSSCCFDHCEEARDFLYANIQLLLNPRNFQAIDKCPCGPYCIGLHHWPELQDCKADMMEPEWVVALNPQCYPSQEMACEAIQRSKRLINDEGLHLVEHILLRPEDPEQCECARKVWTHPDNTGCEFRWTLPGDPDLCLDPMEICFVPGEDPFSFIATVAMPAWPVRYRSAENRQLLENILRREAPAHVMLRILWLAPHDFCHFENEFKKWQRWISGRKHCLDNFDYCTFLSCLFHNRWQILDECQDCPPCAPPPTQEPCREVEHSRRYEPLLFHWQASELYDWTPRKDLPVEKLPQEEVFRKPERVFLNQRREKYREKIEPLVKELKRVTLVGEIRSFLEDIHPSPARLKKITEKLLAKMQPAAKGKKPVLNESHAQQLMELSLHHYLDRNIFPAVNSENLSDAGPFIRRIRQAGLNLSQILKEWQPREVAKYRPDEVVDLVKKMFSGRK